jgi:hypothetical protein
MGACWAVRVAEVRRRLTADKTVRVEANMTTMIVG